MNKDYHSNATYGQSLDALAFSENAKTRMKNNLVSASSSHRNHFQRSAAYLIAAVLILALSVTALAAVGAIHFDRNGNEPSLPNGAFGTGVNGQETLDRTTTDKSGNVVMIEHYPGTERVNINETDVDKLLGGHINEIDQGITLGDYTFIVRDAVFDQNNVGVVTFEIENPNGHGYDEEGRWLGDKMPAITWRLTDSDGNQMDGVPSADRDSYSDTHIAFIYYTTPLNTCDPSSLILTLTSRINGATQEHPIQFSIHDKLPTVGFSDDNATAEVSATGMLLTFADTPDAFNLEEMVINFEDGSEYIVKNYDLYNIAVTSRYEETGVAIAFNRLVDVQKILSIHLSGRINDSPDYHEYIFEN